MGASRYIVLDERALPLTPPYQYAQYELNALNTLRVMFKSSKMY